MERTLSFFMHYLLSSYFCRGNPAGVPGQLPNAEVNPMHQPGFLTKNKYVKKVLRLNEIIIIGLL